MTLPPPPSAADLELADGAALVARATRASFGGRFEEVYALLRDVPPERMRAEPELGIMLARSLWARHDYAPALRVLEAVHPHVLATGSRYLLLRWSNVRSHVAIGQGRLREALGHAEAALAAADPAVDLEPLSWIYNNLGILHSQGQNLAEALSHLERSALYGRRARDPRLVGVATFNAGVAYRAMGLWDEAMRRFDTIETMYREEFGPSEVGLRMVEQGIVHAAQGDPRLARAVIERALGMADPELLGAQAPLAQASVAIAEGDLDEALGHLHRAVDMATVLDQAVSLGDAYQELAYVHARRGQAEEAEMHLRTALVILEGTGFTTAVEVAGDVYRRGVSPSLLR